MHGTFPRRNDSETIAFFLEQAKSLIADPDDWLQRDYKRDHRRCAVQAVRDVFAGEYADDDLYSRVLAALAGEHHEDSPETAVCNRNDSFSSHTQVMDYFDNAISRVRAKQLLRSTV